MTTIVAFIGPAGSGKTSLVKAFGEWIKENLYLNAALVNLDPGVEKLPYKPVFDIRKLFTLRDVMWKYNLGPNGAFIKASELIAENIDEIMENEPFSNVSSWDMILVDTPGQMEAFIFRPSSNVFFNKLLKKGFVLGVYIIDASAVTSMTDAIVLWFLGILAQVKLGIQTIPVINKVDIAKNIEYVKTLIERPDEVLELIKRSSKEGLISDLAPELAGLVVKTQQALRPVLISANKRTGLDELYYLIHEAFCACGDLT